MQLFCLCPRGRGRPPWRHRFRRIQIVEAFFRNNPVRSFVPWHPADEKGIAQTTPSKQTPDRRTAAPPIGQVRGLPRWGGGRSTASTPATGCWKPHDAPRRFRGWGHQTCRASRRALSVCGRYKGSVDNDPRLSWFSSRRHRRCPRRCSRVAAGKRSPHRSADAVGR